MQAGQRPAEFVQVRRELDVELGVFVGEKREAVPLVGRDDQFVGNRRKTFDHAADKRPARELHERLALPHAPALAARLDDDRDLGAQVVALEVVGERRHVIEPERGNAVQLRRLDCFGNVGHHGDRVRRGHLRDEVGVRLERAVAARLLYEVGAAAAGALGEGGRHVRIGCVRGAHDLDRGKAALAVPLHDHDVMAGHRAHDLGAFELAFYRFHARNLARGGDHRLGSTRLAMTVRVLARDVDLEVLAMMVLHAAHIVPARDELVDELHDERGLARIVPPHHRNGRAWNVYHISPLTESTV